MKGKKTILIIILVAAILSIIGIILTVILYSPKPINQNDSPNKENGIVNTEEGKQNVRQEIIQSKEIDGITFTNINCYYDGKNTNISYTITNTTDNLIKIDKYKIEVYDDTNKKIKTLNPYLGRELTPGEEYNELISTSFDLSSAYSIEIFLN